MTRIAVVLATLLVATPALAEKGDWNFHIELGGGLGPNKIAGGWLKLDTTLFGLGPVAPQIEAFAIASHDPSFLANGQAYGAGIGLRLRLLNDEEGYLFMPGEGAGGNMLGNLWIDAHLTFTHADIGLGFDAAAGYSFSWIDGLQFGPYGKFTWSGPHKLITAGVAFSVGVPYRIPEDYDPDNDGIKGGKDKCPNVAEDRDGFEDKDGCPETDNDKDQIADDADKCPDAPEDYDGFEDKDGCPELDNDKDGVRDEADKCPMEPEDKDGFQDGDGCPELDNDKDGISDSTDKCPNKPEDKDGFEDEDGCPDWDNDRDGIADLKDKCPLEPETFNGVDDEDGCPEKATKVYVTREKIVITEKIFFAFNKANILPKSDALLDNVAMVLNKFPQVRKIRIEGHTDDVGSAAKNQVLSEKRAKSVYDAMVKRNVDKNRLESAGFGMTRPLAQGKDEVSRELNRRVEFIVVEMDPIVEEVIPPEPAQ
jgi:outer membrane protein OmpA-like peptidoglycan-associated protein